MNCIAAASEMCSKGVIFDADAACQEEDRRQSWSEPFLYRDGNKGEVTSD